MVYLPFQINVADPNVTVESLDTAFGSLYQDEITVEAAKVKRLCDESFTLVLPDYFDHLSGHLRPYSENYTVLKL